MKPAGRVILTAAAIAGATMVVYAWRLGDAPIHLSPDEAIIAVDAHTLASTGRDVHGSFLPLFFKIQLPGESRMGWFTPVIFYLSALVLKVVPLSEGVVRIPSMLVGVVNVVLMYFVGRRLFQVEPLAIIAAALLALTPAHFILSRYALDYLYPLPFVLGWFLCLLTFLETKRPATLFTGTLLLGIGVFSYIAALVLMPLYFLATCIVVLREPRRLQLLGVCAAGFGLPLLFLAGWLIGHPTAFADTAARYDLYDTKHLNALQGLRSFLSFTNVDRLASLYWSFFNPSFLFFTGDRQTMFSTKLIGVFTLPVAFLLPAGIYSVLSRPLTTRTTLVFLGFVTAPLAALLGGEDNAITRAVTLLPFTALLATFGIEYLWSASLGWFSANRIANRFSLSRMAAIVLLVLIPAQFALFYRDYFTDYRLRSSPWLSGNLRGALETLIEMEEQQHAPRIYFAILASTSGLMDIRNRWMGSYWQFYLIKHQREDLLARSGPFEMGHVREVPTGSLVLANIGEVNMDSLVKSGELKRVRMIPEVSGPEFFSILQR
jgi:4-amino-4-deoxy-L-arabinose transferase-like glycosyltransferase